MKDEIWKDIAYYEESYQISNYGRVRNKKTNKYKAQHDNGKGYLTVDLWKNNKGKKEYVHRLVALAFIPNPDKLPQVNHKDEDKQNNYVENLEWCTAKYNNNYGNHTSNMVKTCRENGVYEKTRERMINNNPNVGQWTYGKNNNARKVICDGKVFDCIKECAEYYGINYGTFRGYLCNYMPKRFRELGLSYFDEEKE